MIPRGNHPPHSPNWSPRTPRTLGGFFLHSKPPCCALAAPSQLGESSDLFSSLPKSHSAFSRFRHFYPRPFFKVKTSLRSLKMLSASPRACEPAEGVRMIQESLILAPLSSLFS